ncbi:MAG TPA: PEP-CTERM sorting domain-containing protein [Pirellulales bacterium]|jgi:hypothetical protein|nr:PEP-CTERM sorting domain-containing protein [Pirellulales bacterium]
MKLLHSRVALVVAALGVVLCGRSFADPLTGEVLKFQQLPLNNGAPAYAGAPVGQLFPGHDEPSEALLTAPGSNDYVGPFAADDFSDKVSTSVVHIRWWGSYLNNSNLTAPPQSVQKFLISFESDVPGGTAVQPFSQPGTPLLTEEVTPGALSPASGTFTEQLINGNVNEHIYQYNAELALPFNEVKDTVYWLKIVALVDPATQGGLKWGWHNRDWGITDNFASTVPSPGENIEGTVITSAGPTPVWHFQDDAVTGRIDYGLNTAGVFGINSETTNNPLNYVQVPGATSNDGPTGIENNSEDLAFELYTTVPEPSTIALLGLGGIGLGVKLRQRRRRGLQGA